MLKNPNTSSFVEDTKKNCAEISFSEEAHERPSAWFMTAFVKLLRKFDQISEHLLKIYLLKLNKINEWITITINKSLDVSHIGMNI